MLIRLKQILKPLFQYLFPKKCVGCQKPDFWVCPKCVSEMPRSYENPFSWSFSVFEYRSKVIRKAVWKIKFTKKYSALDDLSDAIKESFLIFLEKKKIKEKEVILIPIPITAKSMKERGYNQSLMICKILEKSKENIKTENGALVKSKNHKPQNKIKNRFERLNNIKNSFALKNAEKIKGKIIVLVDDVTTTGATLSEARKVLLASGEAKKVFAFTVAH